MVDIFLYGSYLNLVGYSKRGKEKKSKKMWVSAFKDSAYQNSGTFFQALVLFRFVGHFFRGFFLEFSLMTSIFVFHRSTKINFALETINIL